MKIQLLLVGITLLLMPQLNVAQTPNLGTAASFSFFTSVGAFGNTGATYITGDIGTNSGALTGFPPGTVVGQTHIANATSIQAAIDVDVAYNYLLGLTCGTSIGTALGNNQTLTPNIYCLNAASTLNGNLILDGQGNANAVFIFKIDGALTTSISSTITLINSASLNNVYWQITGAAGVRAFRAALDAWLAELERPDGPDADALERRLAAARAILEPGADDAR